MPQSDAWSKAGRAILTAARNELYLNLPFLDAALCALPFSDEQDTDFIATDGQAFFFNGSYLALRYEKSRNLVCRAYLHLLLHCMLLHPAKRQGRDGELWDLCCDIAVEHMLDSLDYRCLAAAPSPRRSGLYRRLEEERNVLTAEALYRFFKNHPLEEYERATLAREFFEDDHSLWEKASQEEQEQPRQNWQQIAQHTQTSMETVMSEASGGGQAVLEQLRVETRETADYRAFLRRFAVTGEESGIDADTFDYNYYTYGLRRYGNMPLIEPLETREVQRIRDLVIAIDTSMSTSGELVRRFLQYTYGILKQSESFFRSFHLRILQCDDQLRVDKAISSRKELEEYMENFELAGQGATDFRPVFRHVDSLVEQGAFHKLRGVIYFTDGLGIYPAKRPAYDAAFVMLAQQGFPERVPPWGIRILLDENELQGDTL